MKNNNVLAAGPRGPQLLQDVYFREKLAYFDREVIRVTERNPETRG
ncbi:MAG: catalase [Desulfomonile sp.]